MLHNLLNSSIEDTSSVQTYFGLTVGELVKLAIYYGIIAVVIIVTIIIMGVLRRRTKSQLRPEKIKKACLKAKKYAKISWRRANIKARTHFLARVSFPTFPHTSQTLRGSVSKSLAKRKTSLSKGSRMNWMRLLQI